MKNITKENIISYIVGKSRSWVFNTKFDFILRKHIREQITHRLRLMRPACYSNGSCEECGCITPALQMADKTCDGACYPSMFDKNKWKLLKEGWVARQDGESWVIKDKFLYKIIDNE